MTGGVGARAMSVVDATPVQRWLALAAGLVMAIAVFWGGALGRVDESGRAAEVACRAELAPAGDGDAGSGAVMRWDVAVGDANPACPADTDALIGAHEALVTVLSVVGGLDGRWLAVLYIAAMSVVVGSIVRRVPGPAWVGGLTGTALVLVVADGSVTSAFTSLDPAPVVLVGVLVVAAAALPRRSLLGLVGGAFLVMSSIGAPWNVDVDVDGVVERYEATAESVVAPRDVGDGVPAITDRTGPTVAGTCRVCAVSNLGDHARSLAPLSVPVVWLILLRSGVELTRRARRAGEAGAAAVGRVVVGAVTAAAALFVAAVLDGAGAVDVEAVTVLTALAAAMAIPMGYHLVVLGRRLDVPAGVVRRAAIRAAQWLVVPVPTPVVPSVDDTPTAVPARPYRPMVDAVAPRPEFASLAGLSRPQHLPRRRSAACHHHPVASGPALARRSGQRGRSPPECGRDPPRGTPRTSSRAPPRWRSAHGSIDSARAPPAGARRSARPVAHTPWPRRGRSDVGCQPTRIRPAGSTRNLHIHERNTHGCWAHDPARPFPHPLRVAPADRWSSLMGGATSWPEPLPRGPVTVTVVLGTRPEAIKLSPVIRALDADPRFSCRVVHTGQHAALAADVLAAFDVDVDVTLDLLRPGQGLAALLARAIAAVGADIESSRPDVVIVQGDTTTAAGAALASAQFAVPVAHVEAGLRSGDRSAPFPEEDNRRIIASVAGVHLAATAAARDNLVAEGVASDAITVTGNTGIDALDTIVATGAPLDHPLVERVVAHDGPVMLVTTHRRESWGADMSGIASAVARLLRLERNLLAVVPLHPNPTVRDVLVAELGHGDRALLCDPLPYAVLANVMASSSLVLTDSGGLQEEAPRLGVPVLVLRRTTERPEGIEAGAARLVGTDPDTIVDTARAVLHDDTVRRSMGRSRDLYGDGRAAERVVAAIAHHFGLGDRPDDFEAPRRVGVRHR